MRVTYLLSNIDLIAITSAIVLNLPVVIFLRILTVEQSGELKKR